MSSEEAFVSESEQAVEYTNVDAAKEDRMAEESEATGKVSKGKQSSRTIFEQTLNITDEVEGLKDTIGGGEILDDSEGYTRASNKDVKPMQQEEEIDAAVGDL